MKRKEFVFSLISVAVLTAAGCAAKPADPGIPANGGAAAETVSTEGTEGPEDAAGSKVSEEGSETEDTGGLPEAADDPETDAAASEEEQFPATVTILGTEYDRAVVNLDLSGCTPEDIQEVASALSELPALEEVRLMDEDDSSLLSPEDVAVLMEAAPGAEFDYRFDLFDQRLSLSDTVVRFEGKEIGNEGEETIRLLLTLMKHCTYFVLDDCGIDDEIMAGIREDYPDTKVVWRVHVGNKSALTDDTVIRMTHGIDDSMTGPLQYCTDVVYMDLGHDSGISDISFVANMPDLECLILSSSSITDLTPLKNCPVLTWLELVECRHINDVSPIAGMESIKYLNISFTGIRDLSPIMDMGFERFSCIGNGIPQETIDEFKEKHPDCMTAFSGTPWGYAWRYDDHGYTFCSYYARMREVFRYEERSPGGFKFPEYADPENESGE